MVEWFLQYSSEFITALLTLIVIIVAKQITKREPHLAYFTSEPWKIPSALQKSGLLPYYGGVLLVHNQGGRPARNVRIYYPSSVVQNTDFEVASQWPWKIEVQDDGSKVLIIDLLPPKHSLSISYVTMLPSANPTYIGHEEGAAKKVTYIWRRAYPTWFNAIATVLFILGIYTAIVLMLRLIAYLAGFG